MPWICRFSAVPWSILIILKFVGFCGKFNHVIFSGVLSPKLEKILPSLPEHSKFGSYSMSGGQAKALVAGCTVALIRVLPH